MVVEDSRTIRYIGSGVRNTDGRTEGHTHPTYNIQVCPVRIRYTCSKVRPVCIRCYLRVLECSTTIREHHLCSKVRPVCIRCTCQSVFFSGTSGRSGISSSVSSPIGYKRMLYKQYVVQLTLFVLCLACSLLFFKFVVDGC